MNLIPTSLSRAVAARTLLLQKNSPTILFGAGVVGMVSSTVLACRATLKLEETIAEVENNSNVHKRMRRDSPERYSEKELKKDLQRNVLEGAIEVGKLYAPSVVLGVASIGMLTKSHNILTKRNAALTAAYAALDRGFREYRQRVVEKYGEDVDDEMRYGVYKYQMDPTEKGKKPKIVNRVGPDGESIYARFFDEYNANWSKDPEINLIFIRCQQQYLNDLLHARGHVFLNEAYDALGMERSSAGQVVGWLMACHGEGDNYIDFGVFRGETQEARDFVNGRERSILLDFNVDGVIFDKIDTPREAISWQQS